MEKDESMLFTEQICELRGALMEACVLYVNARCGEIARSRVISDADRRIKELLDLSGIRQYAEFEHTPWWESPACCGAGGSDPRRRS